MTLRRTFAVLAAAAVLITTGCGSADKATPASETKKSAAVVNTAALSAETFVDTIAKAQLQAKTSHIEMEIDANGQNIKAVGDVQTAETADDAKMSMTMTMPGMGEIEMRMLGGVFYMKMGAMTGDKFFKLDLQDPDNPLGETFGDMSEQMDPSKSIEALKGAITSLEKDGEPVKIDGVMAQPYKVVVDGSKVKGSLNPLEGSTGADSIGEMSFVFWIGSDNLPRKMTSDIQGATVQTTFTKWGKAIDVKAPDAGQISEKDPFGSMLPDLPAA